MVLRCGNVKRQVGQGDLNWPILVVHDALCLRPTSPVSAPLNTSFGLLKPRLLRMLATRMKKESRGLGGGGVDPVGAQE